MKFSVVIPTLNEEKYIGYLLDSLVKQTFKDFEVVIVDAHSDDKTKEKAMEYENRLNIQVVDSSKRNVSFQRNLGADAASYENLIFFDADITVEKGFLEKIKKYLQSSKADVLTSWFEPMSTKKRDKIIFRIFNVYLEALKHISPGGAGAFIYVRKGSFKNVGGFSEDVVLAEDFDLIKRLDKKGCKYSLLRDPIIKVSVRRLNKEGRLYLISRMLRAELHIRLRGPIKDSKKIKYEFGKYD